MKYILLALSLLVVVACQATTRENTNATKAETTRDFSKYAFFSLKTHTLYYKGKLKHFDLSGKYWQGEIDGDVALVRRSNQSCELSTNYLAVSGSSIKTKRTAMTLSSLDSESMLSSFETLPSHEQIEVD